MALTRETIIHDWTERKNRIDSMLYDSEVDDKTIFEELCCSVYSGDEYDNVQGIIENDVNGLIDTLCHIVIADYAVNSLIDSQVISMPDHSEILATICAQLKRDSVDIHRVYDAVDKADTANWFVTNGNELSMVHCGIKEVWDRA